MTVNGGASISSYLLSTPTLSVNTYDNVGTFNSATLSISTTTTSTYKFKLAEFYTNTPTDSTKNLVFDIEKNPTTSLNSNSPFATTIWQGTFNVAQHGAFITRKINNIYRVICDKSFMF